MHTTSKEESVDYVNELLIEAGQKPLKDGEVADWGLIGGESFNQLEIWVNDFLSELHTEICQAKNDWRYEL